MSLEKIFIWNSGLIREIIILIKINKNNNYIMKRYKNIENLMKLKKNNLKNIRRDYDRLWMVREIFFKKG